MSETQFRFDFAVSYASEDTGLVEDIVRYLAEKNVTIYMDRSNQPFIVGKRLEKETDRIYGPLSRFCVPVISKYYIKKYWTRREYRAALREEVKRGDAFILPIMLDDVEFDLIEDDRAYIGLRKVGTLNAAHILFEKLASIYPQAEKVASNIWVTTFGIHVIEFMQSEYIPEEAPKEYISLCDWLERDLFNRMRRSKIGKFTLPEPTQRTGETLSVRIAFKWNPEDRPLDFGELAWWEVLEVAEFGEIYPDTDISLFSTI
jgi:hypothetical protein